MVHNASARGLLPSLAKFARPSFGDIPSGVLFQQLRMNAADIQFGL